MTIPHISSPFPPPGSASCLLIVRSPPIHRTTFHQTYRRPKRHPQIRRAPEKIKPHAERSNHRHNRQRTINNPDTESPLIVRIPCPLSPILVY